MNKPTVAIDPRASGRTTVWHDGTPTNAGLTPLVKLKYHPDDDDDYDLPPRRRQ